MVRTPPLRLAALLVLTLGGIAACGKDSGTGPDNGSYYYRFDANGTRITFTQQASLVAAFGEAGNQRDLVITGYDADSNSAVQIYDNAQIGTGTWSGYNVDIGTGTLIGVIMHYRDASGTLYQQDTSTQSTDKVTITDVNATSVRGTFSGHLKAAGKPDLTISNGEFYVKRVN